MNNIHFSVNGLQNTQMKTQLKNVLKDMDGVRNVYVDLGRGAVDVDYNDPVNAMEIRQGIEQVGCKIR
ncbi:MAG TPA: heavy metal transporter [Lachnospiraceae bacterium]|jgi:copper chaperone CopZ|nr:heavy metal transporter [Lachnospiraceae bacterium]HBY71816.1 heavy metal transporter [Lachnospiraceae bacterium]HCR40048.1 heavy metal transporter [Lachnospiraceae bacterium]